MHVLGLTDHLGNVGGAEISARTILTGLADQEGVDRVTVVGADLPDVERLQFPGVGVVPVTIPGPVVDLPDLARDLYFERRVAHTVAPLLDDVDIVHAHHRRSALALARLDAPCPTVATVRDYWPTCPISVYHVDGELCTGCGDRLDDCIAYQGWDGPPPKEWGVKAYLLSKRRHQRSVLAQLDCAVFIADHLRDKVGRNVELPEETTTIYNPVSLPEGVAGGADSPPPAPVFVTASSLTAEKGVDTAIRAVGEISETFPEVRLVVFGDGPLREEFERLASEVAPGVVEFRGRVPPEEVYAEMSTATATIFPSRWDEPFGRITVEAMLLGVPVVATDAGGIAELVDDGETGLLFPVDDVEALAGKLATLLETPEERERLARTASATADRFNPARISAEYYSLFQRIV